MGGKKRQRSDAMKKVITPKVVKRMKLVGLPLGFLMAVFATLEKEAPIQQNLDAVEFFAGTKKWSREIRRSGYEVATMELADAPLEQDILSPRGLLYAFRLVFSSKPKAVHHWATVCSSWVTINRSTSGRSYHNPLGFWERRPYVGRANVMVSRTALLILTGVCLGVLFLLEQPITSLMLEHPRLRQLIQLAECGAIRGCKRISTYMGAFGAVSPKPTMLLGNAPWIDRLKKSVRLSAFKKDASITTSHVDSQGRRRFTGGQGLKRTQEYPKGYGVECAVCMDEAVVDLDEESDFDYDLLESEGEQYRQSGGEFWTDAELSDVWPLIYKRHGKVKQG